MRFRDERRAKVLFHFHPQGRGIEIGGSRPFDVTVHDDRLWAGR